MPDTPLHPVTTSDVQTRLGEVGQLYVTLDVARVYARWVLQLPRCAAAFVEEARRDLTVLLDAMQPDPSCQVWWYRSGALDICVRVAFERRLVLVTEIAIDGR